jgi:hypothetical protein
MVTWHRAVMGYNHTAKHIDGLVMTFSMMHLWKAAQFYCIVPDVYYMPQGSDTTHMFDVFIFSRKIAEAMVLNIGAMVIRSLSSQCCLF